LLQQTRTVSHHRQPVPHYQNWFDYLYPSPDFYLPGFENIFFFLNYKKALFFIAGFPGIEFEVIASTYRLHIPEILQ